MASHQGCDVNRVICGSIVNSMPPSKLPQKLITIDGGAHCGKSTAARLVSTRLGWPWVSTGLFYRAAALVALREGISPEKGSTLARRLKAGAFEVQPAESGVRILIQGQDVTRELENPEIDRLTPLFSRLPPVRAALMGLQRAAFDKRRGLIAEGRDIGTVVFPKAPLKIFLTVAPEKAAERMSAKKGMPFAAALAAVIVRDAADRSRTASPTMPAKDALIFDTSHLDPDTVADVVFELARSRGLVG